MSKAKHSYVPFYMDDWLGGTARMTRLIKSVYFDICLYTWDKVKPVPEAELMLMLDDLGPQGEQIVNVLVASGRLIRNPDGSVYSERALLEAEKAHSLWLAKSAGGKRGSSTTNADKSPSKTPAVEPEPEPDTDLSGESGATAPLSVGTDEEEEKPAGGEPEKPKPVKTYDTLKIAEAWNAMAAANGLAQIKKLTEERRKKIRARLDHYSEAEVIEAIGLIPARPFCMGHNDRGWKADIDFFVRPDTVAKLLEGSAYTAGGGWLDA